ncbi:MAG: peptidylprolyl isomerase [Bacteroidota bacterium]
MSVLENLRKRSGLLVAIVGLALLAFVLTGLFEGGSTLFGGADTVVGEIGGKTIDYRVFNVKVQDALENEKRNQQKTTLDENEINDVIQRVWNQTINEEVMNKEYEKLGIAVSDDELVDLMIDHPHQALLRNLSDPQTGKVVSTFADDVTGEPSPAKIRAFTQAMTDEQETQWAQLEDYVRKVRTIEKYNNLIKKGLYVTTVNAKRDYIAQNQNAIVRYITKNYRTVPDSTIQVTDAELQTYYNANQNQFKQEASRKVEYVAFDINPSVEDMDEIKKSMKSIAEDFKTPRKLSEDSAFVVAEADSRLFDMSFHTPGTLSPEIDTLMFKAEVGTVIGPYMENGAYKASKLITAKTSADSAKVRHILIAYKDSGASPDITRTKEEAKKMADSLLTLLKKGAKFTEFVDKFSDDRGKKMPDNKKEGEDYPGKGGDYGWLNSNSSFVEPFKNAGLDGKKGELSVIESNYGYHIMEVLDTKGAQKKIQVATIDKKIEPSSKTMQAVFLQASEFAGKNTTNELFQQAVIDSKLNKRIADNIKENDRTIPGIESPRPLIRWAYENKKGAISQPMEFGNKFIVASLTEVKEKGIAPLEQVKDAVTTSVIKEKKAEQFTKELSTAMTGTTDISALGSKLNLSVDRAENVNYTTNALPGTSDEPGVIGAISVQKAKTLSKPLKGREAVFVAYVEQVTEAPAQKDYKTQQLTGINSLQPRVDYEVYEALKETADVKEHLLKFY